MQYKVGLYIVSTPIGNLEDISIRALNVLKNVDIIFCEDSRITNILLAKYSIKTPLKIYNDWSGEKERKQILELIKKDQIICLVSDCGTPLISDPGYKLIRYLQDHNVFIDSIPGPSSLTTAITLSGLPSDNFYFGGFVGKNVKNYFSNLQDIKASLICFVSPRKLLNVISVAINILGDREACIIREISKIHQESRRDRLANLVEYYEHNTIRGEIVLIIGYREGQVSEDAISNNTIKLLVDNHVSTKSICDILVSIKPDLNRKSLYKRTVKIKAELSDN